MTYLLFCASRNWPLWDNDGLMTAGADGLRGRSIWEIGLVYVVEGVEVDETEDEGVCKYD